MNYVCKVELDYANSNFFMGNGNVKDAIEYMLERCLEHEKYGTALADSIKYEIEFTSAGAKQLFLGWIKDGMTESPSKMASEMFNCIPLTLKNLI